MLEQWRDIPDYFGYYQVSNMGRIRSLDRVVQHPRCGLMRLKGKILSARSNSHGHLVVMLSMGGIERSKYVHQLVAITWIGPCPDGQQIRHGPAGILDNSVSNLCYGTSSQDGLDKRRDGTHGGRAVRRSDGKEFINLHVAAEESDCSPQAIWAVCKGHCKSACGYGWEYV